jgi:predicted ester cyclase
MPAPRSQVPAWPLREGTHQGQLLGIPATGKYLRLGGMSIYRLAEGKITEAGEEFDRLEPMSATGACGGGVSTTGGPTSEPAPWP